MSKSNKQPKSIIDRRQYNLFVVQEKIDPTTSDFQTIESTDKSNSAYSAYTPSPIKEEPSKKNPIIKFCEEHWEAWVFPIIIAAVSFAIYAQVQLAVMDQNLKFQNEKIEQNKSEIQKVNFDLNSRLNDLESSIKDFIKEEFAQDLLIQKIIMQEDKFEKTNNTSDQTPNLPTIPNGRVIITPTISP